MRWKSVGNKPFYVLFAFSPPPNNQLTQNYLSVAWNVVVARGNGNEPVTYIGNFGFGHSDPKAGNRILGSIHTDIIALGQSVDLVEVDGDIPAWDEPVDAGKGKLIVARNKTRESQNIDVGTIDDNGNYNPMLFWPNVAPGLQVQAQIHPILRAYVNTQFQKNEILSAELMKDTPIWEANLANLPSFTTLEFSTDDQGTPQITQKI